MIERLQKGAQQAVVVMTESRSKANAGSLQANDADAALAAVTGSNRLITEMTVQIASAAEEQAAVAQNISEQIDLIHGLATENAAGADRVEAASFDLAKLATNLHGQVGSFKL